MSTNVKIVISAQDKASNVIANITRQLQQLEMTASQMKTIQIRASGAVSQAVKATSVKFQIRDISIPQKVLPIAI